MSRFSFKTWLLLPFIIIIRLPFALLMILTAKLSYWLENLSELIYGLMVKLPEVKYRQEWIDFQFEKNKKERLNKLKMTSQIKN